MFDINFFQNTFNLKKQIVSGQWKTEDSGEIFSLLENHRNNKPYLFNIETTNNCNMTCVMCPRTNEMDRKIENMDKDVFGKIAKQIFPHEKKDFDEWISFVEEKFGINKKEMGENHFYFFISSNAVAMHGFGEPVLDPDIKERVYILSMRGIPTYFSCNPSNINFEKIESLFQAGLKYIKFSIDSMSDEKMRQIRGRNSNFTLSLEKILQLLDIKKKRNYPVTIVACMIKLSKEQDKEAEDFLRLWEGRNVYSYIKSQDNQWYFQDTKAEQAKSHYESQYCEFPWTSLSIMVDGTVVPCTQDFNCEMPLGNVRDNSLKDIWNSEKYRQFRRMHIKGEFPKYYRCKERCDLRIVADYLKKTEHTQQSHNQIPA